MAGGRGRKGEEGGGRGKMGWEGQGKSWVKIDASFFFVFLYFFFCCCFSFVSSICLFIYLSVSISVSPSFVSSQLSSTQRRKTRERSLDMHSFPLFLQQSLVAKTRKWTCQHSPRPSSSGGGRREGKRYVVFFLFTRTLMKTAYIIDGIVQVLFPPLRYWKEMNVEYWRGRKKECMQILR